LRIPSLLGEAKEKGVIAGRNFSFRVSVDKRKEKHGWDEKKNNPGEGPFCRSQLNSSGRVISKASIYQIFQQFATMMKTWCIIKVG
jgi:hypothetical protein